MQTEMLIKWFPKKHFQTQQQYVQMQELSCKKNIFLQQLINLDSLSFTWSEFRLYLMQF